MPFWLDCFDFAVRAIDSGVGLALDRPPAFSADEVALKLARLLTESCFRERAQYWGEQLRKSGGVSRAADLIITMLDRVSTRSGTGIKNATNGPFPKLWRLFQNGT